MTTNSDAIVPPVQHDFHNLWGDSTGPAARTRTAYPVACTRFRRLLARGATR
jgi:hypothetical protein